MTVDYSAATSSLNSGRLYKRFKAVSSSRSTTRPRCALFSCASIETVELSFQPGGADHTKRVREVVISGNFS